MGASPVTPNSPNLDGHVVPACISLTSTGGTTVETVNLPTYAHKIDTRIAHPVRCLFFISTESDATGSENFALDHEMARGTDPDSTGEWVIVDADTVKIYKTADQDGLVIIHYIAFGVQLA